MEARCPACRTTIRLDDVNVSKDVALCRPCGKTSSFAELTGTPGAIHVDLQRPPPGAWFEKTMRGFEVGASTRSGGAFFIVPTAIFWSFLTIGLIAEVLQNNFPLVLALFSLPFLAADVFVCAMALMMVIGKTRVRVQGDEGEVFSGIGPIGWRRRFNWRDMGSARALIEGENSHYHVVLEGQRRITFGFGMTEDRRHFIVAALRSMLCERRA